MPEISLPEVRDLTAVGTLVVLSPLAGRTLGDVDNTVEASLGHNRFSGPTVHHHIHLHELFVADAADRTCDRHDREWVQRLAAFVVATRVWRNESGFRFCSRAVSTMSLRPRVVGS